MRFVKPLLFIVSLSPFAYLLFQIYLTFGGDPTALGADPAKAIVHFLGEWALIFLLISLGITPIWKWLKINWVKYRRMLGLFAFFYGTMHLVAYFVFLLELDLLAVARDVYKRPYITVGTLAWLILLPLAVTSTNGMQRRLRRNWKRLHRGVYLAAILVIIHIFWQVRSDFSETLAYSALLLSLLLLRLFKTPRKLGQQEGKPA